MQTIIRLLFISIIIPAIFYRYSSLTILCTEIDLYSDSDYVEDDILNEVFGSDDFAQTDIDYEESDKIEVERAMKAAREAELAEQTISNEKKSSRTRTKPLHNQRDRVKPGGTTRSPQQQQQQQQQQPDSSPSMSMSDLLRQQNTKSGAGASPAASEFKMGGHRATMGSAGRGGGGKAGAGAEQLVGELLRARYEQAQQAKAERARAVALHKARCSVSRALARPVERILALYNGPQEDWLPDMYAVLGVSARATEAGLKKAYRALALVVHPDKNPHPDAQAAFDALQDAYSTLAAADLRSQYDMDLARARKGRRLSIRRMRKLLKEWWVNLCSSCSLLRQEMAQVGGARSWARQQGIRIHSAAGEWVAGTRKMREEWLEHMLLLPSAADRVALFHEQFVRLLPAATVLALLHSVMRC